LRLTPDSAACIASFLCTSGGTRTINFPLKCLIAIGSGIGSSVLPMSNNTSATRFRMPFRAFSGVSASQLKLGNSAHRPTYSLSSSDQVTRYVYLSFFVAMTYLQFLNSQKHLLHLICLGLSFFILDVYPWIPLPRCLVNAMTAFFLTCFTKEMVTYSAQIRKPNILRISLQYQQKCSDFCHGYIVSALVLFSRVKMGLVGAAG